MGEWSCFFFFSSRRRHTRFDCDWSSDVCSSDLLPERPTRGGPVREGTKRGAYDLLVEDPSHRSRSADGSTARLRDLAHLRHHGAEWRVRAPPQRHHPPPPPVRPPPPAPPPRRVF